MRGSLLAARSALACLAAGGLLAPGAPVAMAQAAAAPAATKRIEIVDLPGPQGRTYRISIARPDGPAPATGYPVIYVLDANALFPTVADSARLQSFRPSWTGIGPAVVVGIGYPTEALFDGPARTFDLTIPVSGGDAPPGGTPPMKTGGADAFLAFIEAKVKPLVAGRASIDTAHQTLLGHSLGGLFVLHTLFTRPDAFASYVAISPSVWWGNGSLYAEAEAFAKSPSASHPRLLMTMGEYEQALSPAALAASGAAEQKAALDRLGMVDGFRRMAAILDARSGMTVRHALLAGEDHGSGVPRAVSLGVRFALLGDAQFEPGR